MKFYQAKLMFSNETFFKNLALKAPGDSSFMSGSSQFHTLAPEKLIVL